MNLNYAFLVTKKIKAITALTLAQKHIEYFLFCLPEKSIYQKKKFKESSIKPCNFLFGLLFFVSHTDQLFLSHSDILFTTENSSFLYSDRNFSDTKP